MTSGIISTIEATRKEQGLSVREVADKSGVSMNYIYMILRGEHTPSVDVLIKLLAALGKKLDIVDDSVQSKV